MVENRRHVSIYRLGKDGGARLYASLNFRLVPTILVAVTSLIGACTAGRSLFQQAIRDVLAEQLAEMDRQDKVWTIQRIKEEADVLRTESLLRDNGRDKQIALILEQQRRLADAQVEMIRRVGNHGGGK